MNYPIICKLLSVIMSTLALAFLASYAVGEIAWIEARESAYLVEWILSASIACVLAVVFAFLGRGAQLKLFRKEALTLIGTGWILASLVGATPYWLIIPGCGITDAIFESTSGLTTTGATVLSNLETYPHSLLFWRSLSQWVGGLGVVVFFVALLSSLGAGAKILYSNESTGTSTEIDSGRIQQGVLQIILLYLGLSGACLLAMRGAGLSWFDAICHMFTTISTGGFGTYDSSIAAFNNPSLEWIIILFMALGGTSFFALLMLTRRNWRGFRANTEVKAYYLILLAATAIVTTSMYLITAEPDFIATLRTCMFQVVSIATTTGFTTDDYMNWLPITHVILLLLMIFGGCSGSTSGGTKIVRLVVALKITQKSIEKSFRTRVVRPLYMNGRVLDQDDQENIMGFILLMTMVFLGGILLLSLLEPQVSFAGIFSAVASTLFNIGPGVAEIGPSENYAFFGPVAKCMFSLLMIMGRLELYAILVLFVPSLWKKFA